MNPHKRIALLSDTLGPVPRTEPTHTTAERAALMLRFAPPQSKAARRLRRQAKGVVAPSPLTDEERAQLQEMLDADNAPPAAPQGRPAPIPPTKPVEGPESVPSARTDVPSAPARLMPRIGYTNRRNHGDN